jgi:hypothetical protein
VGKGVRADQPVDALAQAPQATVERACVLAEYRASAAGIERSWRTAGAPRVLTCALLRCLAWLARGMPAAETAVCLPSKHCWPNVRTYHQPSWRAKPLVRCCFGRELLDSNLITIFTTY